MLLHRACHLAKVFTRNNEGIISMYAGFINSKIHDFYVSEIKTKPSFVLAHQYPSKFRRFYLIGKSLITLNELRKTLKTKIDLYIEKSFRLKKLKNSIIKKGIGDVLSSRLLQISEQIQQFQR